MSKLRVLYTALIGIVGLLIIAGVSYLLSPPPSVLGDTSLNTLRSVGANASFQVSFSGWMNTGSVEQAFAIDPPVEGSFSWKGNTLLYTPTAMLTEGDRYTVTIQNTARSILGKTLPRPYQITYLVTPPPAVSFVSPNNMLAEARQPITIMFNAPMVPLTTLDQNNIGDIKMTITPETKGQYKWIDTQTLQFIPTDTLVPSSTYQVTVHQGSKSVDGGSTLEDTQFQFETAGPEILGVEIEHGHEFAGPPTPIAITFNQKINKDSLKEHLTITPPTPVKVEYDKEDDHTLIIAPAGQWNFDTNYSFTITQGLAGTQGEKRLLADYTETFTTVGTPALRDANSTTPQMNEPAASIYGFGLEFNTPLKENALEGHLRIEPAVELPDLLHEEGPNVYFDMNFAYSTTYTVTITKGVEDIYGQQLAEDITYQFTTMDRPASIGIDKRDYFSLFSSYDNVVYPVKTVNISKYQVEFCPVTVDNFLYNEALFSSAQPNCSIENWEIPVENKKNELITSYVDFEKLSGARLTPGVYYLRVFAPEVTGEENWRKEDKVYFFVTSTALAVKKDYEQTIVWATDIRSGLPVANLAIELYQNNAKVAEGSTNAQGIATIPFKNTESVYVIARREGDVSVASSYWQSGIAPWDFNIEQEYADSSFVGYLYTDRPIYRPGDTVHFKGMVRFDKDAFYELPTGNSVVTMQVDDAQYNSITNETVNISANGTFEGSLTLSSEAALGQYHMNWKVNDQYLKHGGYRSFFVEEYRKPEFQVTLTPLKNSIINGEDIKADINASYFFGGALANATATWTLTKSNYYFDEYKDGWYNFSGDEDYQYCFYGECDSESAVVTQGNITLDSQGNASLSIPLSTQEDTVSKLYTLEVTVTDQNSQSFSTRSTIPWHMGNYYIGMKNQSYVVSQGEEARFDLLTVDTAGTPVANKQLTVEFFKREWKSVKKKNVDGNFYWESETIDSPVGSKQASTGADGKGTVSFIPTEGGYFVAKAKGQDERGNTVQSMAGVYVSSDDFVSWNQSNNNRIDLVSDKSEYNVGETAKVLIPSPFANGRALVTYERGTIFHQEVIELSSSSHTLEIPITEKFLPNAFISVVLIKDNSALAEEDIHTPEFRVGYKNLKVNTAQKELELQISTDKERYLPGEQVTMTVTTKDHAGTPVNAEVAVGVVDASILALKGNPQEDLLKEFYYQRGLGVQTGSNLTIFTETINVAGASAKGGGGGNDALENKKRGEFKDTAYWNPTIQTVNGTATVTFTLPDNLTTWHAVALGITNNTLVGDTSKDIMASKQLLVRPVLPRFLRFQDRVTIGAIVHNFTDQDQKVTVTIEGSNLDLKSAAEKSNLTIKPGENTLLTWNTQVLGNMELLGDNSTITIKATANGLEDTVSTTLPIEHYATPETVALFGETEQSTTEYIQLPDTVHGSLGHLILTVSNALVTNLDSTLSSVVWYPYGCVEQISSRLLAIALYTSNKQAGQSYLSESLDTSLSASSKSAMEEGLPIIYQAQRGDGGWGYWQGSNRSYPYLTAHVLYSLHYIREAGFAVDSNVVSKATSYLTDTLRGNIKDNVDIDSTARAYMLYVLAVHGKGDLGLTNTLLDQKASLNTEAKTYIALTLQLLGDNRARTILDELTATALQDAQARYIHFANKENNKVLMSSDVRTTALALQAMLAIQPDHPLMNKTVAWLQHNKDKSRTASTQETIHTLIALQTYLKKVQQTPPTEQVTISFNNEVQETVDLSPALMSKDLTLTLDKLIKGADSLNELTFSATGSNTRLFYQGVMEYFLPVQEIAPRNAGFSIKREYFALDDTDESKALTFATKGQVLKGKLTIIVPADRYNVAVESHLPAGFEGVNFNLDTTAQALQEELDQHNPYPWWYENDFTHTEVRDDRIVLFADHLTPGVYEYDYLVNVTSEGIFNHPPALVYEMYYPEVFGRSRGEVVNVK